MGKIVVISDIHGNLEALKVVLKDIKSKQIDKIICLGDIIGKGIHIHECLNLVKENCDVVLKGNYCENIEKENKNLSEVEKERIQWIKEKLTNEELIFIKNLPFCYELYISGRLVRFFHATANSTSDIIANINSLDKIYELLLPSENTISKKIADIVIYGHIHMQYMQKMYNRTIINVGSVGNALDVFRNEKKDADVKNTTTANYLIITGEPDEEEQKEISFEFVSLPYDIEKELENNDQNIEKDAYLQELRYGNYRNNKKVEEDLEKLKNKE